MSVVVCTRDRSASLLLTLQSLADMRVPDDFSWELVVVNNGSVDNTDSVLSRFEKILPMRRVFHASPGLGGARNAGLRVAAGQVVAWIDDDCLVDSMWLTTLWLEFVANPEIAGLGGRVELYNQADLPLTIQRFRMRATIGEGGRFSRDDVFMISACNMAFRSSTYAQVGEFDPLLGPGTAAHSADDTDFLYRTLRAGNMLAYAPDVLVYHNHGRRTAESAQRLLRGYAIGRGAFFCKHLFRRDVYILRILLEEVLRCMRPVLQVAARQFRWLGYLITGAWRRLVLPKQQKAERQY